MILYEFQQSMGNDEPKIKNNLLGGKARIGMENLRENMIREFTEEMHNEEIKIKDSKPLNGGGY